MEEKIQVPFSILGVLSNIFTNIRWIVLGFWEEVKSIFVPIFFPAKFLTKSFIKHRTNNKLNEKISIFDLPVSGKAGNHVKIYHIFVNAIFTHLIS